MAKTRKSKKRAGKTRSAKTAVRARTGKSVRTTAAKPKVRAANAQPIGIVRVWIPVVELDWEPGRLEFSTGSHARLPATLRKRVKRGAVAGWRVRFGKSSIGLEFDLSKPASRARFRRALELGWNEWWVAWDWKHGSVQPDNIQNSMAKGLGEELRALVDGEWFENLERYSPLFIESEFGDVDAVEEEPSDPPQTVPLYDCRDRCEDPWRIELVSGKKTRVLYDFQERGPKDGRELIMMLRCLAAG